MHLSKPKGNTLKIKNTFAFVPAFRAESKIELVESEKIGSIMVTDGEITMGNGIATYIKENPSDTFLVSSKAFDQLTSLAYKNVAMLDPSTKEGGGADTTYGGLIFSK